jgi:hypothetical protein
MLVLTSETEALIQSKAVASGLTADEFLRRLIGLKSTKTTERRGPDIEAMRRIARQIAALPVRDSRSAKEILEDAWGL